MSGSMLKRTNSMKAMDAYAKEKGHALNPRRPISEKTRRRPAYHKVKAMQPIPEEKEEGGRRRRRASRKTRRTGRKRA